MVVLVWKPRVRIDMVQKPLEAVALKAILQQFTLVQITNIQALDRGVHVAEETVIVIEPDTGKPRRVGCYRVQLGIYPAGDGVGRDKPGTQMKHIHT